MASLGLHCCTAASLAAVSRGFSTIAVRGLLTGTAPLAENRLYGERASAVVAHGLNCPEACGIPPIRHQPMAPALGGGFFAAGPQGRLFLHFPVSTIVSLKPTSGPKLFRKLM